ncbi:probable disease resistance protein At4g27220 [Salvia miltiorrhiza]|uniref:probable disease resistance protein At4g27220 n=1 Tax=Salvia miltiorrhiza TaxID=226208 RepID=UPI0025AB9DDA|nr:probable disease resistance protein At4g27220 [Salvia miltiorrhiza]
MQSNAERSKNSAVSNPIQCFKEDPIYSVYVEDEHLWLNMHNLFIVIGDYPSASPLNAILNLVEQDLCKLHANYPNSLALFLQRNTRLTSIHPNFFDTMPDLCFLDLSDSELKTLPYSLFNLPKLAVLLLRNCRNLETLSPEIRHLKTLEVLDLSGTCLRGLPNEICLLQRMKIMKLTFYSPLESEHKLYFPSQYATPSFVANMRGMQSLSIWVKLGDRRWSGEGVECIINDITKLEGLTFLELKFPQVEAFANFIVSSPSWKKQRLKRFFFTVTQGVGVMRSTVIPVSKEVEKLFHRGNKCLKYIDGDHVASRIVNTVLNRATSFYLDHHVELRSLSEFNISSFKALEFCLVIDCRELQEILDEKSGGDAFPCLEFLGMYSLPQLRRIWTPPRQAGWLKRTFKRPAPWTNFGALKYLVIDACPKLQFVFLESVVRCLANLEELEVRDCKFLEITIKEEGKKVKYKDDDALPRLWKVTFSQLPRLHTFGCPVRLLQQNISVYRCPYFDSDSLNPSN